MNLSDVVQQRRGLNLLDLSCGKSKLNGYRARQLTYTNRMARGVRVTSFDCLYHHLKEFLSTVLQLMVQPVYMAYSHNRER